MRGVNLVGRFSGDFGLAVAARMTALSLIEGGVPLAIADIVVGGLPRRELPPELKPYLVPSMERLPYDVTVVHDNLEVAGIIVQQYPSTRTRVRAIVPFWELTLLPLHWRQALGPFDAVLYPSQHVRAAFSNSVACVLREITIATHVPSVLPEIPAELAPPAGTFAFFTSFNTASSAARKNPAAVVEAFRRAFPGRTDVSLVVNCHNNFNYALPQEQIAEIRGAHPMIRFLDLQISYEGVMALQRACHAYVSLHRAEGLGLGLLEAMAFGRPVIATDYSSTTDFVDETNGGPVRYALVPVAAPEAVFSPAAIGGATMWADADIDHAAWWMRRFVDEPGLAARLGAGALATTRERRERAARARWLDLLDARGIAPATAAG